MARVWRRQGMHVRVAFPARGSCGEDAGGETRPGGVVALRTQPNTSRGEEG